MHTTTGTERKEETTLDLVPQSDVRNNKEHDSAQTLLIVLIVVSTPSCVLVVVILAAIFCPERCQKKNSQPIKDVPAVHCNNRNEVVTIGAPSQGADGVGDSGTSDNNSDTVHSVQVYEAANLITNEDDHSPQISAALEERPQEASMPSKVPDIPITEADLVKLAKTIGPDWEAAGIQVLGITYAELLTCQTFGGKERGGVTSQGKFSRPGYYRHRDCDYGTPTHCLPCPPGTYTEHTNYLDRCRLCVHCSEDHGMEERRACLPNQNRRCRCMKGFFLHPGEVPGRDAHMCYRHQQCQPGEGVKKEGTRRSDKTCAPCAMGMFSQGGNHPCQDWTNCASQGLKEMIPGTTEHDAVCDYIAPVSSNVTVPQVPPTVGGGVTLGSVSDRMETPGKPVPDGYDLQLSPSTTNPLQHSPSGNKREGAGTSAVSHLLKKGNDTPTTLAVAIVGLLLLVGCIGVTVYCGYVRFIKEKGGRGERIRGVSVAYHAQSQGPEDTVSLTEQPLLILHR
ncbi:TNFRSF6B [Branchiostoma lanceolatum]|uniref:TNFRSF6B protein n=1 Tax=Branchiostoma lanceolatum TaxID=7740 RepID=A0A8J9W690_BRALA|nr:TNFRSF6B [Branchiostoma lanceolatum]